MKNQAIHFASLWLFTFFLYCFSACQPAEVSKDLLPPNILLIISDDQAWNDYSFMGHPTY